MCIEKNTLREIVDRGSSNIPFYVYTELCSNYTLYLHWHNEIEMIYVEKGTVVYNVENIPLRVSGGQCIIINSGQLHSGQSINSEACLYHAVLVDLNFLKGPEEDYCQKKYISPLINGELKLPQIIDENTSWGRNTLREVKEVIELYGHKTPGWEMGIKASLYKMLAQLAMEDKLLENRISEESHLSYKIGIIKKSIDYIQNNYKNKIYISDLAGEVNMNSQYFCRFFKKNTGKTPVDFINQFRIEQAAKSIAEENKKISDICFESGFDNFSYFIKKFKEYKNCTPYKYKLQSCK